MRSLYSSPWGYCNPARNNACVEKREQNSLHDSKELSVASQDLGEKLGYSAVEIPPSHFSS